MMKNGPNAPVTLEYQSPSPANSQLRRMVCRYASRLGGFMLFLSVPYAIAIWWELNVNASPAAVGVTAALGGWYFAAGILYVFLGIQTLRRNAAVEKILIVGSWINAAMAIALVGSGAFYLLSRGPGFHLTRVGAILLLGYIAVHVTLLVYLALLSSRLRRGG